MRQTQRGRERERESDNENENEKVKSDKKDLGERKREDNCE